MSAGCWLKGKWFGKQAWGDVDERVQESCEKAGRGRGWRREAFWRQKSRRREGRNAGHAQTPPATRLASKPTACGQSWFDGGDSPVAKIVRVYEDGAHRRGGKNRTHAISVPHWAQRSGLGFFGGVAKTGRARHIS